MRSRVTVGHACVLHGCVIEDDALIGIGAIVLNGAKIGAGAVVVKDVPDFALVVGNPGKLIGWMCTCGNRLNFARGEGSGGCQTCQQLYWKEGQQVSPKHAG